MLIAKNEHKLIVLLDMKLISQTQVKAKILVFCSFMLKTLCKLLNLTFIPLGTSMVASVNCDLRFTVTSVTSLLSKWWSVCCLCYFQL